MHQEEAWLQIQANKLVSYQVSVSLSAECLHSQQDQLGPGPSTDRELSRAHSQRCLLGWVNWGAAPQALLALLGAQMPNSGVDSQQKLLPLTLSTKLNSTALNTYTISLPLPRCSFGIRVSCKHFFWV